MTSHELAKQLLANPDMPVQLLVIAPKDSFLGDLGDVTVSTGKIDIESAHNRGFTDVEPGQCLTLRGFMSSEDGGDDEED